MAQYEIIFDGGSLGNPGHGYGSYVITSSDGFQDHSSVSFDHLGDAVTNNQAEYLTLIAALDRLVDELGLDTESVTLDVGGDSQLVVNQVNGVWRVRNADLRPLHAMVLDRLSRFGAFVVSWHPRARSVEVLGH